VLRSISVRISTAHHSFGRGKGCDEENEYSDQLKIASPQASGLFFWRAKLQRDSTVEQKDALALPRSTAARALGLSIRSLDRLIQAGAIRTVPAFRRKLVTVKELNRFLSEGGYAKNPPERVDR
jgi:hypothetical protein